MGGLPVSQPEAGVNEDNIPAPATLKLFQSQIISFFLSVQKTHTVLRLQLITTEAFIQTRAIIVQNAKMYVCFHFV